MLDQKYLDAFIEGNFHKEALGKHLEVFKAYVDGHVVEVKIGQGWEKDNCPRFENTWEYRVAYATQALNVPWEHIDKKWKYAVVDKHRGVFLSKEKPEIDTCGVWLSYCWVEVTRILNIDTTHVTDYRQTLTERPEGV